MNKTRLAVLFGGETVEHEVSVITGLQLMRNANADRYEVIPVYIDKAGKWWTGAQLFDIRFFNDLDLFNPAGLTPFSVSLNKGSNPIDVAILCFHGGYGESGNVQGVLEVAGIPYQGPGVVSSAINFDKIVTRQILKAEGIRQANYIWFTAHEWQTQQALIQEKVAQLTYPVFVKPANGGSTIGIEKVKEASSLVETVNRVIQYDERIIVEAEIKDCIEINVSVLGMEGDAKASVPEQPIKADEFLSYADKYERGGGKKSGMASASRRIPAPISSSLTQKVQALAKHLFHILDCSGVVRIDFFVDPSEETLYVTEVNTIPGSMSFYLWEATGMKYKQMIDELVKVAQTKFAQKQNLIKSFESNILKNKTEI